MQPYCLSRLRGRVFIKKNATTPQPAQPKTQAEKTEEGEGEGSGEQKPKPETKVYVQRKWMTTKFGTMDDRHPQRQTSGVSSR